jgi:hypothetical protein
MKGSGINGVSMAKAMASKWRERHHGEENGIISGRESAGGISGSNSAAISSSWRTVRHGAARVSNSAPAAISGITSRGALVCMAARALTSNIRRATTRVARSALVRAVNDRQRHRANVNRGAAIASNACAQRG